MFRKWLLSLNLLISPLTTPPAQGINCETTANAKLPPVDLPENIPYEDLCLYRRRNFYKSVGCEPRQFFSFLQKRGSSQMPLDSNFLRTIRSAVPTDLPEFLLGARQLKSQFTLEN